MVAGENISTGENQFRATLCTTNLTRSGLASNRDIRGQISYGLQIYTKIQRVPRSEHTSSGL
jgi:hypothetical protein